MKKRMVIPLITVFISIIILGGCDRVKHTEVIRISEQANTLSTSTESSIKDADFVKWNGSWNMGVKEGAGSSASMTISNANQNQFEFIISATFVNTIINNNGEEFLNPHMGEIEGVAYFVSPNEAYYTTQDKPDYKMIFHMAKENQITIEEIATSTGKDFGYSPMAGVNVRYLGEYVK